MIQEVYNKQKGAEKWESKRERERKGEERDQTKRDKLLYQTKCR